MDTIRTYKLFRPPESYSSSWLVTWDCVYNLVVGHSQATLSDSKVTTSICKATRTKPHGAYGEFLSADDIALQGKIRLLTNCPLAVITHFVVSSHRLLLQCSNIYHHGSLESYRNCFAPFISWHLLLQFKISQVRWNRYCRQPNAGQSGVFARCWLSQWTPWSIHGYWSENLVPARRLRSCGVLRTKTRVRIKRAASVTEALLHEMEFSSPTASKKTFSIIAL